MTGVEVPNRSPLTVTGESGIACSWDMSDKGQLIVNAKVTSTTVRKEGEVEGGVTGVLTRISKHILICSQRIPILEMAGSDWRVVSAS